MTNKSNKQKENFTTEQLIYYFDTVKKDRRLHDNHNYKQAEWYNLRNKLIRLPMESFDTTLNAIEKLIDEKMEEIIATRKASMDDNNRLSEGKKLYDSK